MSGRGASRGKKAPPREWGGQAHSCADEWTSAARRSRRMQLQSPCQGHLCDFSETWRANSCPAAIVAGRLLGNLQNEGEDFVQETDRYAEVLRFCRG